MGMWDGVKQNQSRRLIVAAERVTGKTSAFIDMALEANRNVVILTSSVGQEMITSGMMQKRGIERSLFASKFNNNGCQIIVTYVTSFNPDELGDYDIYVDEPWNLDVSFLDTLFARKANRIVMMGTPPVDDYECGVNPTTELWHSGCWDTVNLLRDGRGIPHCCSEKTVTDRVMEAIAKLNGEINRHRYADITVKVQDGRVVMTEITSKHKPA